MDLIGLNNKGSFGANAVVLEVNVFYFTYF